MSDANVGSLRKPLSIGGSVGHGVGAGDGFPSHAVDGVRRGYTDLPQNRARGSRSATAAGHYSNQPKLPVLALWIKAGQR